MALTEGPRSFRQPLSRRPLGRHGNALHVLLPLRLSPGLQGVAGNSSALLRPVPSLRFQAQSKIYSGSCQDEVPLQPGTGRDKELQQLQAFHPTPPFAINRSPGLSVGGIVQCLLLLPLDRSFWTCAVSDLWISSSFPLIDHQLRQSSCALDELAQKHLDSDRFGEGEGPDASIPSAAHTCPVDPILALPDKG
ncbi:hypothetical protein TgHK011_008809 [Trichoderma gracile]|nr:hypothetical protein TgHK011_008809 [Trichoderma gracile]